MWKTLVLGILLLWAGKSPAHETELLNEKDIAGLKNQSCSLFVFWATWCNICIHDLPKMVKFFNRKKEVNAVLLDVSVVFQQKNFSIGWMKSLKPQFRTYLKPTGKNCSLPLSNRQKMERWATVLSALPQGKEKEGLAGER